MSVAAFNNYTWSLFREQHRELSYDLFMSWFAEAPPCYWRQHCGGKCYLADQNLYKPCFTACSNNEFEDDVDEDFDEYRRLSGKELPRSMSKKHRLLYL